MAFKKITETGENFIRKIASNANANKIYGNQSLIKGNNGALPFSDKEDQPNLVWVSHITDIRTNNSITNNDDFANYLIYLLNKYSEEYGLDANIIAAQAYQESKYNCWIYNRNVSTASSISQIVMKTMYDALYASRFQFLTISERDTITNGMINPSSSKGWRNATDSDYLVASDYENQRKNRSILHQNMINNPHLVIKIQCALMNYVANNNNNLASSTLFAYNRGSELKSTNYVSLVNYTANKYGNKYINEGVKYVQQIFGFLGDKNNTYISPLNKPKGYWFGYKIDINPDKFNVFEANAKSSV